jgi:predicted MFS family arabinose efflux permease
MPLLTVFLLRFLHWRSIFVVLALAGLMVNIVFWFFAPDPKPVEEKRSGLPALLRRKDFRIMVIFWAFAAISTAGLYGITPLFLVKERGFSLEVANTIFGISRVGGLLVVVLMGFVLDRCSIKKIMLITLLWAGLSTVGIAVARNFWLLATLLFVQSTLSNALFPIGFVGISKLTDSNERSLFTGVTISVSAIMGIGIAPLALGTLADLWNFQAGILVLGVATTVSCFSLKNLPEI